MMLPTLILIDVQKAIDDPKWGRVAPVGAYDNMVKLLDFWREADAPRIHIRHDSIDSMSPYAEGKEGHAFKAATAPKGDEIVVGKTTNNAFIETNLEKHLKALGTKEIIIAGVLVQYSVDTTARMAVSLGYDVTIAKDACAASDMIDTTGRKWTAEEVTALTYAIFSADYGRVLIINDIISGCR